MTARTHKEFAISFVYFATFYIYNKQLLDINYYALLAIMLAIGAKGALFPDVDHHWKNVKEKTFFNRVLNLIIHVTGGKHRSYHTHSAEICVGTGAALLGLNWYYYGIGRIGEVNYQFFKMILFAFYSGWISHLFSDALTTGKIYFFGKKVGFVPKKIGKLEFKTGDRWEAYVYNTTHKVNTLMSIVALAYPFMVNEEWSLMLTNLL